MCREKRNVVYYLFGIQKHTINVKWLFEKDKLCTSWWTVENFILSAQTVSFFLLIKPPKISLNCHVLISGPCIGFIIHSDTFCNMIHLYIASQHNSFWYTISHAQHDNHTLAITSTYNFSTDHDAMSTWRTTFISDRFCWTDSQLKNVVLVDALLKNARSPDLTYWRLHNYLIILKLLVHPCDATWFTRPKVVVERRHSKTADRYFRQPPAR